MLSFSSLLPLLLSYPLPLSIFSALLPLIPPSIFFVSLLLLILTFLVSPTLIFLTLVSPVPIFLTPIVLSQASLPLLFP